MNRKTLIPALAVIIGAAATATTALTVAHARRVRELPEPVRRRLQSVDRTELSQGLLMTPLFGRIGPTLIIGSLTSPATSRDELLEQLRVLDAEMNRGVREAGLPDGASALVVLRSEHDPELRVTTADLRAGEAGPQAGEQVSEVVSLPRTEDVVAGGDAQPQDVTLPER